MTPLLDLETLALVARQEPLTNVPWATYCINAASVIVADTANHSDWLGLDADGVEIPVVAAPRRAVMIAEQLAKRAYLNPDAIVAEGSIGPIGGDRMIEEFARTFELTETEKATLAAIAADAYPAASGLSVINIQVRPKRSLLTTIFIPDLDPRADAWPLGTEEIDGYAYTPRLL
jgi:hypothetical protein